MTKLGTTLRNARTTLKLTLKEAANAIGINAGYLSEIETGKRTPDGEQTISLLASFYGIDKDDLEFIARVSSPYDKKGSEVPDDLFKVARRLISGDLDASSVAKIRRIVIEPEEEE